MCCNPNCGNCGTTPEAEAARARLNANVQRLMGEARARRDAGEPLPSLDFLKPVGHDGPHHPIRNPDVEN